jgi:hypothetical protein
MYAETIDTGATISVLRAFGPPDVVPLDDLAGSESTVIGADGFWTVVRAVSLELAAAAAVADRLPRLTWSADGTVPFAQALSPFPLQAAHTGRVTFAVGVQQAGAANAASIIAPMPELCLLPGWTLTLDVVSGAAADALSGVRAYLQRY